MGQLTATFHLGLEALSAQEPDWENELTGGKWGRARGGREGMERGIKSDRVQETLVVCGLEAPFLLPAWAPALGFLQ